MRRRKAMEEVKMERSEEKKHKKKKTEEEQRYTQETKSTPTKTQKQRPGDRDTGNTGTKTYKGLSSRLNDLHRQTTAKTMQSLLGRSNIMNTISFCRTSPYPRLSVGYHHQRMS